MYFSLNSTAFCVSYPINPQLSDICHSCLIALNSSFITRLFENYCFVLLTNRAPPQIPVSVICSTLLFVTRSAKHEFVTPCKIPWISWRQPGLEKFQGMQQWSVKPEEACNCYPSRSPHLVDGIWTLIVPCAQWQQQLPLVECPLSALLRAFCSSDTRHYSWRTMLFASCQV